jgi:septal ring factor EnvC (AmiA/AmiB activator)
MELVLEYMMIQSSKKRIKEHEKQKEKIQARKEAKQAFLDRFIAAREREGDEWRSL